MDVLETLRRPEYTGTNRCWPCTAVNALALGVVTFVIALRNPLMGLGVLSLGGIGILLRGYVVPYTPTFAPRLIESVPGGDRLFSTHVESRPAGGIGDENASGEAVLSALSEEGVLVGDEALSLSDDVASDWHESMRELANSSTDDLATAVREASTTPVQTRLVEDDGSAWIVLTDEAESLASETWLSRPVAIADVAAVRILTDHDIDPQTASNAAAPLRLFLEACPDCGGDLVETTGEDCCGGFGPSGPTPVLACADCAQRLATLE